VRENDNDRNLVQRKKQKKVRGAINAGRGPPVCKRRTRSEHEQIPKEIGGKEGVPLKGLRKVQDENTADSQTTTQSSRKVEGPKT